MKKITTLIFDIDGVLVYSKKLHEEAFIKALAYYDIVLTEEFHEKELCGLPTRLKLEKLNVKKSLQKDIFELKQKLTFTYASEFIKKDVEKESLISYLKNQGYKIALCSNATKNFCNVVVDILEIKKNVDLILSNEDVDNQKPNPEIYIKAMGLLSSYPSNTIIFEDNLFGLEAAFTSGANVSVVENPSYLTLNKMVRDIEVYDGY